MRNRLRKLVLAPVNEMWKALKLNSSTRGNNDRTRRLLADPESVNQYFADISFDPAYNDQRISALRPTTLVGASLQPLFAYEIEPMLRKVRKTAPGVDNLPFWVFKHCSVELAEVVAHLYNYTLLTGALPRQWLTAIITPVPKLSTPSTISDFRPISVTPIMSRIIEKILVSRWLRPAIDSAMIADQFAFRPTGSTTCALVYFMHHVTRLLESNNYVRCLMIDFSKAFDRVNHEVLLTKLSKLPLPDCILNWFISFLSNRSHATKCLGTVSSTLPINRSIIQGSGLGPTFYIVLESDLKAKSPINLIFKYADDTNLLVPECTDVQIQEEFEAILEWAAANKMTVNMTKTKEIVFRRPNPKIDLHFSTFLHIEQVSEAKLLGVIFTNNLLFDSHVNFILKACSQRSFLLRRLRDQGLTRKQLNIVYDAIIISRIMYASQSWSGFLSRDLIGRINGFFLRMYRYGFCQTIYKFEEISKFRDLTLFKQVLLPNNCIHQLLPAEKNKIGIQLRPRGHNYVLPFCNYVYFRHSFLNRCLYNYV